MNKTYLNCYHPELFQALNTNGIVYELEIVKHYFGGLFRKHKIIKIEVCGDVKKTTDKWDLLISSRKPIK